MSKSKNQKAATPVFCLCLLALAFNLAFATQTVAVLPSDGTLSEDEEELLTDKMREAALKVLPDNFTLLKQDVVIKRLGGMDSYMKECSETSCIVSLGEKAQVDYVAQCRVGKLGSNLRITVELYEVKTGGLLGTFSDIAKDFYKLLPLVEKNVPDVFRKITVKKQETPEVKPVEPVVPSDPKAMAKAAYERGKVARDNKDHDKAIAEFTEAIRLDPNGDESYYFSRALLYYFPKKEYDKAIADYTEAIRIKPTFDLYYRSRGDCYKNMREYDKAIADYTEAIKVSPGNYRNYNSRGEIYKDKGDYDKAIADYTEAIRFSPDYAQYYARGDGYLAKGDYTKAVADFKEALRLKPGMLYIEKKLEEALKLEAARKEALPPAKEETKVVVIEDKTSNLENSVDAMLGYKEPKKKIDPQVEPEKKSNKSFWLALALDIAGAGLIYYGYTMNDEAISRHRDYSYLDTHSATRADFDRAESSAWQKVDEAKTSRNVSYVVGSIFLATGIGVHIWF
ncbi:MAG: tetratricopeptide repeat protein [Candidatus Fibromonas sp.]|jgi:tetratricopeptide (TPR) repeat protein|nr:tetratricopeptide repeat protein [Candidatus Fibromonas sp.]